jgi:hypothetical protein
MKKFSRYQTILSFVVVALIVPQIALAAWWNPVSWFNGWSFFHRTDTQTQVLKNRVKELEKKLENTATSTSAVATTTKATASPKKVAPVKDSVQSNRYVGNMDSGIAILQSAIKDVDGYIGSANEIKLGYEQNIDKLHEFVRMMKYGNNEILDGSNAGIASQANAILDKWKTRWETFFNDRIKEIDNYVNALYLVKSEHQAAIQNISKEKVDDAKLQKLINDKFQLDDQLLGSQKTYSDIYDRRSKEYFSEQQSQGNSELELLRRAIGPRPGYSNITLPSYTPTVVQPIQFPKTTYCTTSGGIGGYYSIICN